jgi:hypothetical protein
VMELVVGGQSIKTTAEHPFYVPAKEAFVPAGELRVGDQLVSHDGGLIPITSIDKTGRLTTVYNRSVETKPNDHRTACAVPLPKVSLNPTIVDLNRYQLKSL